VLLQEEPLKRKSMAELKQEVCRKAADKRAAEAIEDLHLHIEGKNFSDKAATLPFLC
jgi:hypothetical protein